MSTENSWLAHSNFACSHAFHAVTGTFHRSHIVTDQECEEGEEYSGTSELEQSTQTFYED